MVMPLGPNPGGASIEQQWLPGGDPTLDEIAQRAEQERLETEAMQRQIEALNRELQELRTMQDETARIQRETDLILERTRIEQQIANRTTPLSSSTSNDREAVQSQASNRTWWIVGIGTVAVGTIYAVKYFKEK